MGNHDMMCDSRSAGWLKVFQRVDTLRIHTLVIPSKHCHRNTGDGTAQRPSAPNRFAAISALAANVDRWFHRTAVCPRAVAGLQLSPNRHATQCGCGSDCCRSGDGRALRTDPAFAMSRRWGSGLVVTAAVSRDGRISVFMEAAEVFDEACHMATRLELAASDRTMAETDPELELNGSHRVPGI